MRLAGKIPAFLGMLAVAGVAGCGEEMRQSIGLGNEPPDEFAVVTRAPLALPPDYNLRPPAPGTRRPQEAEIRDEVRQTLVRSASTSAVPAGNASPGESALLRRAGAGESDPGIRGKVNAETAALAESGTGFVDKIVFWRTPERPGEVVDARKEAQRLQTNQALGKPPSAGRTPTIERRESGFLKGIFN